MAQYLEAFEALNSSLGTAQNKLKSCQIILHRHTGQLLRGAWKQLAKPISGEVTISRNTRKISPREILALTNFERHFTRTQ